MFSRFKSLLRRSWAGARRPARVLPSRPIGRRAPLSVEALEERCVPTTWNVTHSDDGANSGTLRWAVANAQDGDTIAIQPVFTGFVHEDGKIVALYVGRDIKLTHGELYLTHSVTIEAEGPQSTVSGHNKSRVFELQYGVSVTLQNLDITDGNGEANNRSSITGSSEDGVGGGILNLGFLQVVNCTVSGNTASDSGGGIANVRLSEIQGTLLLAGSTVSGNSATTKGGGIFNAAPLTIIGSDITNNSLSAFFIGDRGSNGGDGGGIWNDSTLNIIGGSIANNTIAGNFGGGGGIYNDASGSTRVYGCTLSSNSAGGLGTNSDGGGILNSGGTLSVYNSTLSGNSADFEGGGICNFNYNGTTTYVQGCTFTGNYVDVEGGGIYNQDTMQVVNCELVGNYAGYPGSSVGSGGGIANIQGSLTVSGCTLSLNNAYGDGAAGGGIYNYGGLSMLTVTNSTLNDNAAQRGGGIYNIFATLSVGSSTFSGNSPNAVENNQGTFIDAGGNTGL
jgi:hypothetical protein